MARISVHHAEVRRSGVALIIVIAMLALFAMVGLSFAFYAEYEADSARFLRMAQAGDAYDLEPEKLMSYAMGQLIFGVDKTKTPNSKLYRFSLAESIYSIPGGTIPFNGIGFSDPATTKFSQVQATLSENVGINVPYTYPDLNNAFLARIDSNGKILARSFFRGGESLRPTNVGFAPAGANQEGDVRNMESSTPDPNPGANQGKFVNDAFWMDLDFPIHTAKDGTRFKPLFAFTVVDLDGRVNLAVSGNYQADYSGNGATSRCGLGVWEINPAKVLTTASEVKDIFKNLRFGSTNTPYNQVTFPTTSVYGRIDYSGISASAPKAPAQMTATNTQFENFAWTDPAPALTQSAAGYDPFNAGTASDTNKRMSPYNVEPLVRWRDRGSPALTSDLFKTLPTNLKITNTQNRAALNLVTPLSMSFDTAHLAPFIYDNNVKYQMAQADQYPKSTAAAGGPPQNNISGAPQKEFSGAGTSRLAAELRRINLNRKFDANPVKAEAQKQQMVQDLFNRLVRVTGATPPSAANNAFKNRITTDPEYRATRWLAQFAVNIVDFIDEDDKMTMFKWNPHYTGGATDASKADNYDYVFGVEHNRLLINEAFVTVDNDKSDTVTDPIVANRKGNYYVVNAWAELFNPMMQGAPAPQVGTQTSGATSLFKNGGTVQPCYRLLMAESPTGIIDSPTGFPTYLAYDNNDPTKGVIDWDKNTTVKDGSVTQGDQKKTGTCYYLVGPKDEGFITETGYKPTWTAPADFNLKSPGMTSKHYKTGVKFQGIDLNLQKITDLEPLTNMTLVLQKLVDPTMQEQSDPTQANYNPFVTVDYFTAPKINPANQNNQDPNRNTNDKTQESQSHVMVKYFGTDQPAMQAPKYNALHSSGRVQPLKGTASTYFYQVKAADPADTEPHHYFGEQNWKSNNKMPKPDPQQLDPFKPFFHFDRPLISTAEVFTATCVSPRMLTQAFDSPTSTPILTPQTALFDGNSLLARFLETVTVGDRSFNMYLDQYNKAQNNNVSPPVGTGEKHAILIPGKINLNAITGKEVLDALFDPQTQGASFFAQTDIDNFYNDLQSLGRPIAGFSDFKRTNPAPNSTVTYYNTLFKYDPNKPANQSPPDFLFGKMIQASTGQNEYEKAEALRKVMNNITFTSNTFAVWVTVGFFQVDTNNNPTTEIGFSSGTNIRHRMFAVVDRSQLMIPDQQTGITSLQGAAPKSTDGVSLTTLTLNDESGKITAQKPGPQMPKVADFNWTLKVGMALTIDRGKIDAQGKLIEETVLITNYPGTGKSVTVSPLRFDHTAGAQVSLGGVYGAQVPANQGQNFNFILGHPGPQPGFNLRDYSYVVPYFTLID